MDRRMNEKVSVSYQSDLFAHMNAIDVLVSILGECAVGHHCVLNAIVSIIDRDDHGVVVLD